MKWIRVEDELPSMSVFVLVWHDTSRGPELCKRVSDLSTDRWVWETKRGQFFWPRQCKWWHPIEPPEEGEG